MLKHHLIHPEINAILGRAGHHDKILIADGHYPAATTLGPHAKLVSLNLAPGLVTACQVLKVLLTAIPVETASLMSVPEEHPAHSLGEPPIWSEFRQIFEEANTQVKWNVIPPWDFYDAVATRTHILTIQTGEEAIFANLLLTVGVRQSGT